MSDQLLVPANDLTAPAPALSLSSGNMRRGSLRQPRLFVAGAFLLWDMAAALLSQQFAGALIGSLWSSAPIAAAPKIAILLVPLIYLCLGCYDAWGPGPVERLRLRICGAGLYMAAELTAALALGMTIWMVLHILVAGILLIVLGHYGEYLLRRCFVSRGLWGVPVVVVGKDTAGQQLAQALQLYPELGLRPVSVIDPERVRGAVPSETLRDTIPDGAAETPTATSAASGFLRLPHGTEAWLFASPEEFAASNLEWSNGPLPCRRLAVAQYPEQIHSLLLQARSARTAVGIEIRRDLYVRHCLWLKRLMDCFIALPAVLLAAPIILALGLLIKVIDPGPAFYCQVRVGRNGRLIAVWKLRTMRVDAERRLTEHLAQNEAARLEWQRFYKLRDDPRILPTIGSFIRRTSLDELPQLLSVISGELSLVGPRPFPPYHMDAFGPGFRHLRTSVPPGLTGLWQVSSRSDGDLKTQELQDSYYIRNWSIWLDLYILLQTVPTVLFPKGAR